MSKPDKTANTATKPATKATAKVTKLAPKPPAVRAKAVAIAPTLAPVTAQTFPLGQLIHGENSRKHYAQRDIEERAASIQSSGLLQNLVGYLEGDRIAISAGHTRLKALLHLVATKAEGFTLDYPVPVLIKPKAEALADSLIENGIID
uniref:ParB/Srx family N-terminal domain-containing protein n=1 Tax=uncultured Meiothermus sp. TaxID=157471 RepID=UPI00260DA333